NRLRRRITITLPRVSPEASSTGASTDRAGHDRANGQHHDSAAGLSSPSGPMSQPGNYLGTRLNSTWTILFGSQTMKTGTTEIISSALNACTREMLASLVRTAYSPNIKERGDCSTAICDIQGRTLSLAANAPAHLGATLRLVPQILQRFPREALQAGDVFLANDPYIVGVTHLNDCTVAVPVFVDGQPVAFAIAVAHHSDVGGRVPGSEAGDSVSIFQEGIRIPPLRIYTAGKKNADVIELFLLNSRTPHFGQGDLAAQVAAVDRGATRLGELYGKHGRSNMEKSLDDMLAGT